MSTLAVYPGSFDPLTNGHVDIIARGARLFDRIVVAILVNAEKHPLFSLPERVDIAREVFKGRANVEVDTFDGLLVDYVERRKAQVVVRGLRAISDFEFEFEMGNMNRKLAPEIEMVYLMTAPEYLFLTASRVKELVAFGASVAELVPANVAKALEAHLGQGGLRTGATESND